MGWRTWSPIFLEPMLGLIAYFPNWAGGFLQAYDTATAPYAITSMTYATTNGGQIAIAMTVPDPLITQVGDIVNISGATTGGTGGNAAVNGTFIVNTWTSTSAFTVSKNHN